MADITEHDSEEEGESDCCEDSRVDLFIPWDTIGICDFLSDDGIAVGIESSGWFIKTKLLYFWCRRDHFDSLDQIEFLANW